MAEKYALMSLEDEEADKLAGIIGDKTCKKILNFLADKEASQSEISKQLGMPLNTITHNIKKLKDAGFVQESKHWWSSKGKRIPVYKVANKYIIIAPRKPKIDRLRSFLPLILVALVFSVFICLYSSGVFLEKSRDIVAETNVIEKTAGTGVAETGESEEAFAADADVSKTDKAVGENAEEIDDGKDIEKTTITETITYSSSNIWILFLIIIWAAIFIFILIKLVKGGNK